MRPLLRLFGFAIMAFSLGLTMPIQAAFAAQWADVATISSTLGNEPGRLCVGGGRTDLGCPLTAPYLNSTGNLGINGVVPTTALSVSGTLRVANGGEDCDTSRTGAIKYESGQFMVCRNGTTWEYLVAGNNPTVDTDRITSGTTSVVTGKDTSVTISTGGIERVQVGTNGNVSIGSTSPTTYRLNVAGGTTYLQGGLLIGNVANGVTSTRIIGGLDSATYISFHWGQPDLTFYTNNARRMTIASSNLGAEYAGRVGIGSMTYPSATLHVSGTIRMASGGEACDANRTGAIRYQGGMFQICQNPVVGWEALATTGENSTVDRITSNSQAGVTANATGYISLTTGGVTGTVYFTPSGRLVNGGVSTTGPISGTDGYFNTLRLGQTGAFTSSISPFLSYGDIVGNYSGIAGMEMRNTNTGTNAEFRFLVSDERGSAGTHMAFSMPSSNNSVNLFGMPRNQMAAIFVNGSTDANARALALGTLKAQPLILGVNNAEAMRIVSTGLVGIGTSNPGTLLSVSGTLRISSGGEACDAVRVGAIRYSGGSFQICQNPAFGWEGLATTGANSLSDRITSGTTQVIAKENTSVTIATAGIERMVVGTNGNVGVGQQPIANAMVAVSGTVSATMLTVGAQPGAACGNGAYGTIKFEAGRMYVCRQ